MKVERAPRVHTVTESFAEKNCPPVLVGGKTRHKTPPRIAGWRS
jgi:hypothetical protein